MFIYNVLHVLHRMLLHTALAGFAAQSALPIAIAAMASTGNKVC
jgi:hypothetical protein